MSNSTAASVIYSVEIQRLVNSALAELASMHQSGKLADTPIVNTHFLVRWVARSIKQQDFDRCVKQDLIRWQQAGRSKGSASELLTSFRTISAFYAKYLPAGVPSSPIQDTQINRFLDFMEQQEWSVSTEFDLSTQKKVRLSTEGYHSLVLCSHQCDHCFASSSVRGEQDDEEALIKPMSFFVRGDHAQFVRLATESGFLLHKRTDYKSVVKYHGEYLIYPNNQGPQLAEIPPDFAIE